MGCPIKDALSVSQLGFRRSECKVISTSRPWYHLVAKNQGFSTSILLTWFRSTLGSAFFKLGFRHFEFKLIPSSRQGYHLVAENQGFQTSIYKWALPSRVHSYVSFDERKTK